MHKNGSYIYLQLWALGRAARTEVFKKEDPSFEQVAPSAIALSNHQDDVPRELNKEGKCLARLAERIISPTARPNRDKAVRRVVRQGCVERSTRRRLRRCRDPRRERLPGRRVPPGCVQQAHRRVWRVN